MRFTKIKLGKGSVTLEWMQDGEQNRKVSDGEAAPNFAMAMTALSGLIVSKCEVKGEVDAHTVSISYDDTTGNRTVVVSGTKKAQAGSFAISTPSLMEPGENAGAIKPRNLNPDWLKKVEDLCTQARLYLDGERAQTDAFGSSRATAAIKADQEQLDMEGTGGDAPTEAEQRHAPEADPGFGDPLPIVEPSTDDAPGKVEKPSERPSPVIDDVEGKQVEQHRKLAKANIQAEKGLTVKARDRLINYLLEGADADWIRGWSKSKVPTGHRPTVPADWELPVKAKEAPKGTPLSEGNLSMFSSGGWVLAIKHDVKLEELAGRVPSGSGGRFVKTDVEALVADRP